MGRILVAWLIVLGVLCRSSNLYAQGTPQTLTSQVATPTPEQEDATLHDVALVGAADLWAVGEQAAVWHSTDSGRSWQFLSISPRLKQYALHSICFLTDRVGWIAGGTVLPVDGTPVGIVLFTKDGGQSWTVQQAADLPYLKYVRFFDLENGIAAGERSSEFPTGVLVTSDGGATWSSMTAQRSGRWNAAAFVSPSAGILGGSQGRQGVVARGTILPSGPGTHGLRAFHGASLDASGRGWLAGDGCFLFRSDNHGVSWEPVHSRLPVELEDFFNFHSVAHQGDQAWVAGSPGSVIWHTADAGNTWNRQSTGDSLPLQAIRFVNPMQGAAVGTLGRICLTNDGGKNWTNVRGAGRRVACLAVQTDARQAVLPFLTRWAREEGYRSAIMIATRKDTGEDSHNREFIHLQLAHSVQTAGGNLGWIDWRLPVALPSLEQDRSRLIAEWTQLTDRRLSEVLLESLVAEIRLWKPSILLIDEPESNDFATELLQRASARAMQQAADPSFAIDQQQLGGLQPWQVSKLVVRRVTGQEGGFSLDPLEILPHVGQTLDLATAEAAGQLGTAAIATGQRRAFLIQPTAENSQLSDRTVFGDLALASGSEARRKMRDMSEVDIEKLLAEASHRRRINAISDRMSSRPEQAGQLLGQLNEIVRPLSPQAAAQQLATLGQMYHAHGEWSLAEAVYAELITRYPEQPPAAEAMLWLMKFWTSAEMNWQRLRTIQATAATVTVDSAVGGGIAQAKLDEALLTLSEQKTRTAIALNTPTLPSPLKVDEQPLIPTAGSVQSVVNASGEAASQYQMLLTRWHLAANSIANGLRGAYPQLFARPEMQFITAALARRRNEHQKADQIYGNFMKSLSDDPWNIAARGEAYLLRPGVQSPKPIAVCKTTRIPPILDGVLSDACWAEAAEIRLGDGLEADTFVGAATQSAGTVSKVGAMSVVLLAHDDRFLYMAATIPVHAQLPTDPPQLSGRQHDADLDRFDHISLQLDVDRDYGTYYRFDVDQRGQTREACWDNWAYNPQWYCAVVRDVGAWRVECAIPLEELLPPERLTGTTWGVGITRILPALGSQSWTGSGANVPQPALFGLVRFE